MKLLERFVVYAPDGDKTGDLPVATEWALGSPFCDVSSLTISLRDGLPGSQYVSGAVCEIAMETSLDGVTWKEIPNGRFLRVKRNLKRVGPDDVRQYTMPGYGWLLNKMRQMKITGLNEDGKRMFNSSNPGLIMKTLIDEAQDRGVVTGMTYDFSTTKDSTGASWAKNATIGYEPGLDLFTILNNLALQGMCDWQFEGRKLRIFNPDTVMATGRDITLQPGVDIQEMPIEATIEEMMHNVLVLGDNGKRITRSNSALRKYWGKWEGFISQGGISDTTTMQLFSEVALIDGDREMMQYTVDLKTKSTNYDPFYDYFPGNYLNLPNSTGDKENMRVRGVNLSRNSNGERSLALIVNDRFVERSIRNARRTSGITGGASIGGAGSAVNKPPSKPIKPAKVTGLVVQGDILTDDLGVTTGIALLDWNNTTTNVNGDAAEVASYQIEARQPNQTRSWPWGSSSTSSASITNLKLKSTWIVKVRARTEEGALGAWSDEYTFQVPDDTTPPPKPSKPTLTTNASTVTVKWNGKDAANGAKMPVDTARVELWMRWLGGATPEDVIVGSFGATGGIFVVGNLNAGDQYEFFVRPFDLRENQGQDSDRATITVASIAQDAQLQAQLDQIKQDAISAGATAGQNAANGKSKITYSPSDPVAAGTAVDDTWFKRSGSDIIGQWSWDGSAWQPRTLSHQVISTLDLGKATVGQLDGLYIKAGTLRADRLSVGLGTNLIVDPVFRNADLVAARSINGWFYESATRSFVNTTTPNTRFVLGGPGQLTSDMAQLVPVLPGERYAFQATVKSNIANTFGFSPYTYNAAGGTVGNVTATQALVANTSTDVLLVVTIPANVFFINPSTYFTSTSATRVEFLNPIMIKQVAATTIEDGAITTQKIAATAITADKIASGAITADKISATAIDGKTITGSIVTGSELRTGSRTNGDVGSGLFVGSTGYMNMRDSTGKRVFQINPGDGTAFFGDTGSNGRVHFMPSGRTRWYKPDGTVFADFNTELDSLNAKINGGLAVDALQMDSNRMVMISTSNSGSLYHTGTLNIYAQNGDINMTSDGTGGRVYSNAIKNRGYGPSTELLGMGITSAGTIGVYTNSAREGKINIQDHEFASSKAILGLQPRSWVSKQAAEYVADQLHAQAKGRKDDLEETDVSIREDYGYIAEEVHDLGLDEFVVRHDNKIVGLSYDRLWMPLVPVVREHDERLAALEARLEALAPESSPQP